MEMLLESLRILPHVVTSWGKPGEWGTFVLMRTCLCVCTRISYICVCFRCRRTCIL